MAELSGADDRRDRELPLGGERLRVDDEPRLALRADDVVTVQVLMDEHLRALRRRQIARETGGGRGRAAPPPAGHPPRPRGGGLRAPPEPRAHPPQRPPCAPP